MNQFSQVPHKFAFRSPIILALFCTSAAFITYCSMYAFRKPFTAGTFANLQIWGVDYKIILITAQVLGYMLSKFIGIKVVSEMTHGRRITSILLLIGISWGALLLFGITPYPFNFIWMLLNGLPLGMIWGLVFSFLEGRKNTELLGAGMSVSFIVASGLVKATGKYLLDHWGVSEFWMPFLTGLLFVPPLLLGVWMLHKIPPPDASDIALRTERVPMDSRQRKSFFAAFAVGIVLMVLVYMALTIFRDLRDNFAVEIWELLGYKGKAHILATAEIPIGLGVFVFIALMIFIKNNRTAFFSNLAMICTGGLLLIVTTLLFEKQWISPTAWMILAGFGMYLSYVSFHTMLFERWIALFQIQGNIGFLMYIADAFGYLGSVGILFIRNFANVQVNWLTYMIQVSYITGMVTVLLTLAAAGWFWKKQARVSTT